MDNFSKIGFGGSCHWCTEAVFQSLKGIESVEQGYIASTGEASTFSEAVVVAYYDDIIPLEILIEIHLRTHESTSQHSFRVKYRSAVYYFSEEDKVRTKETLGNLQTIFKELLITQVLPFSHFKPSRESLHNYYFSGPEKPFCKRYIEPKIKFLLKNFGKEMNQEHR